MSSGNIFGKTAMCASDKLPRDAELTRLQERMDDIMLGKAPLDYDQIMMQLDRAPGKNSPGPQSKGHKGATLLYRKIQNLELDPIFLEYLQKPAFQEICAKIYGDDTPVACFRAMFMNKPAHEALSLHGIKTGGQTSTKTHRLRFIPPWIQQ